MRLSSSKRLSALLAGLLLSPGAPFGLLMLRALDAGVFPSPSWIIDELSRDASTYGYMTLSTAVVFAIFGWLLGRGQDRLSALAATDPLTSLSNRRRFVESVKADLARVRRYGGSLSLLLLDIDGLKGINDRGGHQAGDDAIQQVADVLRRVCRLADLPARLGGDEFGVILPGTTAAQAGELASRLHATLKQKTHGGAPTVSIGIADLECTESGGIDDLVRLADLALYRAKESGRDRTCVAPACGDASALELYVEPHRTTTAANHLRSREE